MILLNDEHGNVFQVLIQGHDELQHPQAVMMQFNDEAFAHQFVKWLVAKPVYWNKYFQLHPDSMYQELAKMIMDGIIRFGKLPAS